MSSNNEEKEIESVLTETGSELLVFGAIRLWYLIYFPGVLANLIVHYYGVTYLWTINSPNEGEPNRSGDTEFKSKPFEINGITFQAYFCPNARVNCPDPDDTNRTRINYKHLVKLGTKIISMPNTIRTCTAYYQYRLFKHTFTSRHTYNLR